MQHSNSCLSPSHCVRLSSVHLSRSSSSGGDVTAGVEADRVREERRPCQSKVHNFKNQQSFKKFQNYQHNKMKIRIIQLDTHFTQKKREDFPEQSAAPTLPQNRVNRGTNDQSKHSLAKATQAHRVLVTSEPWLGLVRTFCGLWRGPEVACGMHVQ